MKINENLKLKVNRFGLKVKKYSPEILIGVGIVGTVASGIMACKATLKVNDILEEMKMVYKNDSRPWVIGYSGGKDSTTVVQTRQKTLW